MTALLSAVLIRVIFRRATRSPSIASTRDSNSPVRKWSPVFGKPPKRWVIQPLTVATLSPWVTGPIDGLQVVNGEGAGNLPNIFAAADQLSDLSVEFVLNLADQSLDDVFQGDDAQGAAKFIHDEREMGFFLKESLEQAFQPGGFRHADELAGQRQQVGGRLGAVAEGVKVFDVDHATGFVGVAIIADGESRITGFFRQR